MLCKKMMSGIIIIIIIKAHVSIFASAAGSQASYVNQNGEEGSNVHDDEHGLKSIDTFLSSYGVYCYGVIM